MSDHQVVPRALSVGALGVLALLGPLMLDALGAPVGTYRMFTRPVYYRMAAFVDDGRRHRVWCKELAPHLSSDARRIVATADDWIDGDSHVELLERGLGDIGKLVCRLRPEAQRAEIILETRHVGRDDVQQRRAAIACRDIR